MWGRVTLEDSVYRSQLHQLHGAKSQVHAPPKKKQKNNNNKKPTGFEQKEQPNQNQIKLCLLTSLIPLLGQNWLTLPATKLFSLMLGTTGPQKPSGNRPFTWVRMSSCPAICSMNLLSAGGTDLASSGWVRGRELLPAMAAGKSPLSWHSLSEVMSVSSSMGLDIGVGSIRTCKGVRNIHHELSQTATSLASETCVRTNANSDKELHEQLLITGKCQCSVNRKAAIYGFRSTHWLQVWQFHSPSCFELIWK